MSKEGGKYCAPGKGDKISCYNDNELKEIAKKYNENNKDKINLNLPRKKLFKSIKKKLKKFCNDETCWLNTDFGKEINKDKIFRPKRPESWTSEKRKWLNTNDIEKVLKQYEEKYKDFKFLGPSPIDFDKRLNNNICVLNDLCNFSMKELINNGKYKLGVVFNLDPHDESGSHWVSMFSDFKKGNIYFFDSYGNKNNYEKNCSFGGCVPEISKLMERIKEQGNELCDDNNYPNIQNRFKIFINDNQHQHKGSECGMYSIYYITKFLEGKTFNEVSNNKISDDEVYKYRYRFYRPNDNETDNKLKDNVLDDDELKEQLDSETKSIESESLDELVKEPNKDEEINTVIDPETGEESSIYSSKGKKVINKLLKTYLSLKNKK